MRVLLDRRRPVHDDVETRRHRLGLHDLQPHRMDVELEPELGREIDGLQAPAARTTWPAEIGPMSVWTRVIRPPSRLERRGPWRPRRPRAPWRWAAAAKART